MFSSSSSCSSRPLPIPSHHQGAELGPRVQLSAARVPDVVSHVHIAHPCAASTLPTYVPAHSGWLPLCLVPRLGARRRRRSHFQRGLQLSLGLRAQLFAEEALVTILYGFHAGLEKQRPAFLVVLRAQARVVVLQGEEARWSIARAPVVMVPVLLPCPLHRRSPSFSASGSAPFGTGTQCSSRFIVQLLRLKYGYERVLCPLHLPGPPGSEAMADARSPARRIGLALLQRPLGRAHVQVLPGQGRDAEDGSWMLRPGQGSSRGRCAHPVGCSFEAVPPVAPDCVIRRRGGEVPVGHELQAVRDAGLHYGLDKVAGLVRGELLAFYQRDCAPRLIADVLPLFCAVLAAVSWNTTGASGTEPAYANVTVSCSSNGVADSASNATVASETGTGSATVLVSAGSGRWQVQSHVTSCAATVYYSYLGVASSATAYSTVHAKTVENVTVGTPIPQSTTSVTVPVSWALSAVGYSGDNVAPTYGPLEVSCSGAGVTRTGSLASGTITAGATSANVTVLGLPEMGASYTITCSGANLTAYAGTVTGAAPDFTPGAASSTMSTNSSTAASLFVGGAAVGDGLVERGGRCFGGGVLEYDGASGTEPAYANVTVSCSSNGVADSASNATVASETGTGSATVLVSAGSGRWQVQSHVTSCAATVYYSYLGVASSATAYSTVDDVGDGARELGALGGGYSGDNVAPTYGPLEVSCSGAGVTRTGSLASGTITAGATSANVTVLGLPEMGASYTITCSGANLTAYAGTVTGAAPDFTPGAASSTMSTNSSTAASLFAKSVGPPSVTVSSSGADAVLAAVSWNTTGASGTEPAYANVTVSCSSNGVADSASNATVASETGTGSATVLVSAGSGRWQVQSHVTSCAATVYYSYLGWRRAPRRTRRTVENVTVGTPIPQSTTSVTVPVSWALSAVGYSGDNVAPTYGPLEVSCSGAGVTRTGSLASGTITAGATSASVTVLGLPEMGASYTITCSGANLTAYAGTVTGAAPDFTPGAASSTMSTNSSTAASLFAKSVGPPSVTVSSSGADAVLAAVSWNTTGASGTEPAYANVTVSCSSNGVADSASNTTVASETGTGSATVLVSAGSGRWQVQSHVTSCAATVYYSYLGVASSATAYSTVHAKTVENVTVGTPIPQSTTSVTVPVSWALSAVGYSGDNVAPTYGPLEVSCSGPA
eukprot:tig00021616_g22906.t2